MQPSEPLFGWQVRWVSTLLISFRIDVLTHRPIYRASPELLETSDHTMRGVIRGETVSLFIHSLFLAVPVIRSTQNSGNARRLSVQIPFA